MKKLISFLKDEEGAFAIEYAIVAALVALAFAVGATALGGGLNTIFQGIGDEVGTASIPAIP